MFGIILSCVSQLWDLLCESMSYTSTSSDLMPCATTSPNQSSTFSYAIASTSSEAPSSSASYSTRWDVFLSFRGSDTRNKFTGHLYDKLDSNGIRTFKDDPELSRGQVISDALLDAISKSKAYIVVISENYASSSWCLDELAEILNCYETMQRLVIPVFYNINPAVVRYQTGSFKQAFQKHHVRFETEKVNNWRLTLTEVASFSGYHVSENRSEADVINEIVDELLLKINPKTLYVTKYPVGLDSRVKSITTLLSSETKGVIKFGIYGMGGVGKTTLAKALFNQLVRGGRFKGSCFLANVRENSGTEKGLVSLQVQLINDVLSSTTKVEVRNVDQGIKLIEARICSTKVVVVIDDLDDIKQFQSLVGPFASESVVIITTRDEEILIKTEVENRFRYMANTLDDADSLALFTRHAFGNAEPNDTLMELSKDILCLAGGLPLALEVFGSYLYKRSEVGWKYYIEKLQRSPNSSIQQRLVISLDALELDDPDLKKIFLDIACCFNGWGKQYAVQIIESYYSYAEHHIDMLKKRCLLTIDRYDTLGMHDLLQDMGREIAHNSHDEPGKHSRLWVTEDIHDVLKNHKGTEAIECIIFRKKGFLPEEIAYNTETFERMSKLRFLYLNKVNLTGSFEHTLNDLRWLCWDQCPLECLPSEFYPQNLVILELPDSNMRTVWELNMVSHVFGKLKTLNMSGSEDLSTTPDFTKLPCIETLDLSGCISLETVHVSIGILGKLVSLDLGGCENLRSLPDIICNLTALKVLDISECNSLEAVPTQLGNIMSLTKLIAGGLTVSKLPDSIGNLTKLVELNLRDNKKLETLPDSFCNLRSLEILDIENCSSLEALPTAIGNIETLKNINGSGLTVSKLPDSIGSLTKLVELDLRKNKKLETFPDSICKLRSLEILDISECRKLETLPDELWKITRLRKLYASFTTQLKKLPDIGSSQIALSLQHLKLFRSGITALPSGFSQLSNLEKLELSSCNHLLSIPKLPPNLKEIWADDCESLERIPNLSNLKHLETLDLSYCRGLTEIQGLEELTSITRLQLGGLSGSLVAYNLTKRLFQVYSEFGRMIRVYVPEFINWKIDRDWITESPYWTSESTTEPKTVYAHLLPNQSHNFMGIILCFSHLEINSSFFSFSVKNSTSGFICLRVLSMYGSLMVLVPKSIFSITDDDHRIELTADNSVKILGIHLLYNTETEMIEDVAKKHVIDIDALKLVDPVLQAIFLDIACFFIQWKKEVVVRILETYYSNVDHNIDILKNRCLLTIDDSDELEMNDLVRHVGRKIARNNSPDDPGRHSRLWLSSDLYDVLKNQEGTEVIEGIVPRKGYNVDALKEESFTSETFKKMSKLRFLCLEKVHLTGSFEQTFEDLRWLCWDWCPLKCLPSDFYPPKLVILELRHSTIITMWELNMVPHVFEKLKTLDMSYSQDLTTTPDFTKLPCLESLNFKACESLEEVHISIGSLVRLVSLDLHGCVKLRSLPDTICNLRSLEALDIYECEKLEILPDQLWKITSLRKLNAGWATLLKKLPDIGSSQIALSLQELDLSDSGITALPSGFSQLSNLEQLVIYGSMDLLSIPELPPNLKEIRAEDCWSLERIPNLSNLKHLEKLDLTGGRGLTEIQGLEELTSITDLQLGGHRNSLVTYNLTKRLFQVFSEFGRRISVYVPEFMNWITETPYWTSESANYSESTKVYADLLPNESHNFMGLILCFQLNNLEPSFGYSVNNTTSGFIWSDCLRVPDMSGSLMVIVPKSIFSITDDDHTIEFTADNSRVKIVGIHLLYNTETMMIEDQN